MGLRAKKMVTCAVCEGTGKQIVSSVDVKYNAETKDWDACQNPDMEITCVWCEGSGQQTEEEAAAVKWYRENDHETKKA